MAAGRSASQTKSRPIENRSDRAPTARPRNCSGDAYLGVPRKIPGAVASPRVATVSSFEFKGTCLAIPKSSSFVPPFESTMFAGLQIPVDDSYFMKRFQRGQQSQRDLASLLCGQGTALDAPRQGFPLNELHHQDQAVLFFGNVVDPAGIGMRHFRCGARLLPEAAAPGKGPLRILGSP